MSENDRIDRFLRGLKCEVRVLVGLQKPSTLMDAIELATQVDSIMWQSRRTSLSGSYSSTQSHISTGPTPMELGAAESNSRKSGPAVTPT